MKRPLQVIHHRRLLQHRTKVKIEKQPWEISSRGYSSGSEVFRFRRDVVCVPRGLESSLGRVPQAPRLSHALRVEMGNQCRKTIRVAHFRGSTLQCLRESVCVPSRWKVLSGEFRRRPTALVKKFSKPDRVGRRGLSEPREDFSRLTTYAWTQKWFVQILAAD